MAAIPLPPKKSLSEHCRTQKEFPEQKIGPALEVAEKKEEQLYFVDASHFVTGNFLVAVWTVARLFLRGGCGRQRYNVLAAWNAVTNSLIRVTNTTVVSAETMCGLPGKIAAAHVGETVRIFLDNARYQHCKAVMAEAARPGVVPEFLPAYSPNLNLIERLWKFVKKDVLYGKHYAGFDAFRKAIDGSLDKISGEHKDRLKTLMTHKFHTFEKVSFLAA